MIRYKFNDGSNASWYHMLIEEDNGELKIALVKPNEVIEYEAKEEANKFGTRLIYGTNSSIPYKNAKGVLFDKWEEIK